MPGKRGWGFIAVWASLLFAAPASAAITPTAARNVAISDERFASRPADGVIVG